MPMRDGTGPAPNIGFGRSFGFRSGINGKGCMNQNSGFNCRNYYGLSEKEYFENQKKDLEARLDFINEKLKTAE